LKIVYIFIQSVLNAITPAATQSSTPRAAPKVHFYLCLRLIHPSVHALLFSSISLGMVDDYPYCSEHFRVALVEWKKANGIVTATPGLFLLSLGFIAIEFFLSSFLI
jgi:hypothetical protein